MANDDRVPAANEENEAELGLTLPPDFDLEENERLLDLVFAVQRSLRDVAYYAAVYEHSIFFETQSGGRLREQWFLDALARWLRAERAQRASEPGSRPLVLDLAA